MELFGTQRNPRQQAFAQVREVSVWVSRRGHALVHLGLGPDGHTASLVPGDPVLDVTDTDVALTGAYQWRCRMTLTYPIINRARRILWVVTGSDKAGPLTRLRDVDRTIPAGRVRQDQALLLADRTAAGSLE